MLGLKCQIPTKSNRGGIILLCPICCSQVVPNLPVIMLNLSIFGLVD